MSAWNLRFMACARASVLLALAAAPAASATAYWPASDAALADRAPVIVEARVVSREASPAPGAPATEYLIEIERVLGGSPAGSTLLVRVPGGVGPDGIGLMVLGAPSFRVGEHALLFLRPEEDGSYSLFNLAMGAFHRVETPGRAFWVRGLRGVNQAAWALGPQVMRAEGGDPPRDAARFTAWLEDRALGVRRPADYIARPSRSELRHISAAYQLHYDQLTGLNLRWFAFDEGRAVRWVSDAKGQAGVPGGGHAELQRALAAWNAEPKTNVNFVYGGQTEVGDGLRAQDGRNTLAFDVKRNSFSQCELPEFYVTWAFWYDNKKTRNFRGRQVIEILEGDIEFNTGFSCYFDAIPDPVKKSKNAEEFLANSLGHILGLAFSEDREALMWAFPHEDGRGARLHPDDQLGLQQLYGPGSSSSGPCKSNTTTLCLLKNRFRVEVTFNNQYNGTSGVAKAIRSTDVAGFFYFYDATNFELMVKILNFGDSVKVFYGQLTDLQFTMTVTDTQTGAIENYRNTPGNCGGLDQVFGGASTGASSIGEPLAAAAATCKAGPNTLCFLKGRYKVEVDWRNQYNSSSGRGGAIRSSDLTGLVYFTDKSNIELVIKMLQFPDSVMIFYGALSDLEYTIYLTDLQTGAIKQYRNPAGRFCGGLDPNVNAPTGAVTSWNLTHRFVSVTGPDNCWVREQRERLTTTWAVVPNQPMRVTRENAAIAIDAQFEIGTPYTFVGTVNGDEVSATDDRAGAVGTCSDGSRFEQRPGVASLSGRFSADGRELTATVVNSYQLTSGGEVKYTWNWVATRTN
jgi:hypothetical protein